jgi:hypothetical protein
VAAAAGAAVTGTEGPAASTDIDTGAGRLPSPRRSSAPSRLASVSTGTLVVVPLRLAVAAAILGAAAAEGLPREGVLLAIVAGVVLMAVGTANRRGLRFEDLPVAPAEAVYCPWWQSGLRAALPSTVGVGVLGGVALAFSSGLAGFCGGLVAGMAILGVVGAVQLLAEERRRGSRLYVDWGILEPRRFAGPP